MAYCAQQDLIDRFGELEITQLADRDLDGNIDTDVVDAACADATAEIDGWLSQRLTLPATTPQEVVRRACDIARYMLYDDKATEQVRERYEDALAWLKDVAAGRIAIAGALPTTDPVSSGGIAVAAATAVFTEELFAKTV
jgi:phage gp36-like protein